MLLIQPGKRNARDEANKSRVHLVRGLGMGIERKEFGRLADGTPVEAVTLKHGSGLAATVLAYGGTLAALHVPDRNGKRANIVLGFDAIGGYVRTKAYIGATIGRYANRIAGGRFMLDGMEHRITANEPPNALHGGAKGFDKALWRIDAATDGPDPSVSLSHTSPNGDQGFPGKLGVHLRYALLADVLQIDYAAAADLPTVVNLTNHSYFNLAGADEGGILDHELMLAADRYAPIGRDLIPTGEMRPVAGAPFDFRTSLPIGARIGAADEQLAIARGYDHNFVLRGRPGDRLIPAARVREPRSGRVMEVWTSEPGVQFYTGNALDGSEAGPGGRVYRRHAGFCLETQHFPDSPNRPAFPSTVLRPGAAYNSTTLFRFLTDAMSSGDKT